MRIEHKLQIDVIKGERIWYRIFDDLILLIDGHVGVYLKVSELKIDLSKLNEIIKEPDALNPKILIENYFDAKETKTAYALHDGYAIKIKNENSFCFLKEKFMKMFYGRTGIKIKDEKTPVLIMKYGTPYGIILPVKINMELE